jgi:hypothetical protein
MMKLKDLEHMIDRTGVSRGEAGQVSEVPTMIQLAEADGRRRVQMRAVTTFGAIGAFGLLDFAVAWLTGSITSTRIVSVVSAAMFCIAAVVVWRDSRVKRS